MMDENWRGNRNDNSSGVTINNLGKTSIILLSVFSGLALGVSVFSYVNALQLQRQSQHDIDVSQREAERVSRDFQAAEQRYQEQANKTERETRMLEYYLLELDGKVIKAGIKRPEDSIAGKLKQERDTK